MPARDGEAGLGLPGAAGSSWEGPSDHYAVVYVQFIVLKSERVQWSESGCGCWRGWKVGVVWV